MTLGCESEKYVTIGHSHDEVYLRLIAHSETRDWCPAVRTVFGQPPLYGCRYQRINGFDISDYVRVSHPGSNIINVYDRTGAAVYIDSADVDSIAMRMKEPVVRCPNHVLSTKRMLCYKNTVV
jgi:hypothetical protein